MLKVYDDKNELQTLIKLYGKPMVTTKQIVNVTKPFPPAWEDKRKGEVVMVLQRKDGKIWLIRKKHYPATIYRLPSGGINISETINFALIREFREETNLDVKPKKFLEVIYHEFVTKLKKRAFFASYIFLFSPINKVIRPDEKTERISRTIWVEPTYLKKLYKKIKSKTNYKKSLSFGERADWCNFRSIVHQEVYKLIT